MCPQATFAQAYSASLHLYWALQPLLQHCRERPPYDRSANAGTLFEQLAIEQSDTAPYVFDQLIGLQPHCRLGYRHAPHAQQAGDALLREANLIAIDAVEGAKKKSAQPLLDRVVVATHPELRSLRDQGRYIAQQQLMQRARLPEFGQQRG